MFLHSLPNSVSSESLSAMAITGELDSARFTAMSVVDAAAQLKHMVKLKVQSHHESYSCTHAVQWTQ